jgi:pimeloyl-ACP methyl ester carboxylesterase
VSENNPKQEYRDKWAKITSHIASYTPKFIYKPKNPPVAGSDMEPGVWNRISIQNKIVPLMMFRQPNQNLRPMNWLKLGNYPRTILYFHGGSLSCEYYYKELQAIGLALNSNILCIEYPGFGERAPEHNSTESGFMNEYPAEVFYILKNVVKLDWGDTIVWMNCFGTVIGMRTLWYIWSQEHWTGKSMPSALFISKPYSSLRSITNNSFKNKIPLMGRMIPKNLLSIYTFNSQDMNVWARNTFEATICPVIVTTCEKDHMCKPESAKEFLDFFVNAPSRRYTVIKDAKHNATNVDIISSEIQQTI